MNKVILMGRLVRDPEVRYSQGAEPLAIARYTLAVNRRMKQNGEQDADFINCVAFGKSGEFAEKYFKKGQMISVIGRLQVSSWTDDNNKRHWKTEVFIEEQYFAESKGCTPKKDGDTEGGFAKQSAEQAAEGRQTAQNNAAPAQGGQAPDGFYPTDENIEDDDLPF